MKFTNLKFDVIMMNKGLVKDILNKGFVVHIFKTRGLVISK